METTKTEQDQILKFALDLETKGIATMNTNQWTPKMRSRQLIKEALTLVDFEVIVRENRNYFIASKA